MISLKNTLEAIKSKIANHEDRLEALEVYSTSEQVIGTWLGETLYRIVYQQTLTLTASGWTVTSMSTSNISRVVNAWTSNENSTLPVQADWSGSKIEVFNFRTGNLVMKNLILEFTKTTD